jgi:hypothetical protein
MVRHPVAMRVLHRCISTDTHNQQYIICSKYRIVGLCTAVVLGAKVFWQLSLFHQMHSLFPVPLIASFITVPASLPSYHPCCSVHVKVVKCAASRILSLSQNMNVYYCVHTRPPLPPLLSQMNTLHTLSPYDCKIHFNAVFPSMPKSS